MEDRAQRTAQTTDKLSKDELQRIEFYLEEAQRMSHTGSWAWNVEQQQDVYWSPELFRIWGLDPREGLRAVQTISELVHPDDLTKLLELRDRAIENKTDYEIDFRILLSDGSMKYIHGFGHPVIDTSGTVVELVGTIMDVTQQYQARKELEEALEEIQELRDRLYRENLALKNEIDRSSAFRDIVGTSRELQSVLALVSKIAPTDITVLISGETGTGKERIARAIHDRSHRTSRPFVAVNCAAMPAALIASELFGHERGAFTGAVQRHLGRFELAEGGTIFLDEVGELPPETQLALLRVLQEREFERVGGHQSLRTDVRVIAATNRDLGAAVRSGTFRSDLYYRLNVFPIDLPPLRDRKEDIRPLVEHFIERYCLRTGKKKRILSESVLELLESYSWPGNIRELQNVVERSLIIDETDYFMVDERWLSHEFHSAGLTSDLFANVTGRTRQLIEDALTESNGRVSGPDGAAARLGLPPSTLESKIKSLKIDKRRFRKR